MRWRCTRKRSSSAYYGDKIKASIWNGCSTGGNQGLTLASMYPADFDAIVAGAPPDIRSRVHAVRMVLHRFVHRTAGSYIPPEKYPAVHKAAMEACDLKDGVKDGIIENPPACRFDPKVIQCEGADGPSCLTAEQVETARAMYSDVKHPKTGQVLYTPLLQPGSELLWNASPDRSRFPMRPRPTSILWRRMRRGIRRDSIRRPTWRKWTRPRPC